jgi:chemotaxis response regulator CheB
VIKRNTPDVREEALREPDEEEHQIPVPGVPEGGFPIVGIAASAGGLAAFEAFFSAMPAQLIAYVTHAFGKKPHPVSVSTPKTEHPQAEETRP